MTHQETADVKTGIEKLIDANGLSDALLMIAEICNDKADHVAMNWNDKSLARAWSRAATAIELFSAKSVIQNVI